MFPALDLKNKRQETQVLCSSSKKLPWEKLHHCLLVHCAPPPVSTLQQAAWGDLWTNQKLVGLTKSKDHVLKFMGPLVQLGPHHVCTTLLHRPDTIMSVWNYVSRLCDTSFETSFRHKKTYQMCSLLVLATQCICSKNPFQIIFRAKHFSYFCLKSRIF